MGWQARLPKDQKPEFIRTCNKCGDTGVKKRFISIDGVPNHFDQICRCKSQTESKEITVELPVKEATQ